MFVFFLLGGRTWTLQARHRVAASLEGRLNACPTVLRRSRPTARSRWCRCAPASSATACACSAGEAFPADGLLIEGRTQADEALLTGESRPRRPSARATRLVAGSLNLRAPVRMRVDRLGADTRYEGIVALMRSALTQRPALPRSADRIAGPFLWGVLLLAAVAGARVVGHRPVARGLGGGVGADRHLSVRAVARGAVGAARRGRRAGPARRAGAAPRRARDAGRRRHAVLRQDRHAHRRPAAAARVPAAARGATARRLDEAARAAPGRRAGRGIRRTRCRSALAARGLGCGRRGSGAT